MNGADYMSLSIKEIGEKVGYVMQNPNQMLVKDIIKDEVELAMLLRARAGKRWMRLSKDAKDVRALAYAKLAGFSGELRARRGHYRVHPGPH